ncbi:MAG: Alpha-amylase 1 [Parcubacteria group bacterium ADurb.Bin159]|jgi:hypothetical protein|nr:MAG: Alpha-amylase 1 [Parcubacteria group bacterium ADurb.Bin159]
MSWINFLHFYQPFNQQFDILERVVNESYRPLIKGFLSNSKAKAVFNINGGLLELLDKYGFVDIIENLKILIKREQIELTGSAIYHPFLPLLPEEEIVRQVNLNNKTLIKYLGKVDLLGFFSPELAINLNLAKIIENLGFSWIIAEELAAPLGKPDFNQVYSIEGTKDLKILFRYKRLSVLILSAILRNINSLKEEIGEDLKKKKYILTVMDAETFGHHRPGLQEFLFDIYKSPDFSSCFCKGTEVVNKLKTKEKISIRPSTWSSEEQDFYLEKEKNTLKSYPFLLWQDPSNPIHQKQWEFTYFVIDQVKNLKNEANYHIIREKLDKAISSDSYWWASAKPWWSLEMIEEGAWALKDVIFSAENISSEIKAKAEKYYQEIIDLAFSWQRQGLIREAYRKAYRTSQNNKPYKERVYGATYNSMILEFEDEMKKAIEKQEFEKAIKWRDAIYKLKSGADIYDVLHVIDDLSISRHLPSLKSYWEYNVKEFSPFAQKHFEEFSQEEFIKVQRKKLLEFLEKAFLEWQEGKSFGEASHPLGFSWDKFNNFYLTEIPAGDITYQLEKNVWDSYSQAKFEKEGFHQNPGQNKYYVFKDKLKIIIDENSVLYHFFQFLKTKDKNKGKYLTISLLAENIAWVPLPFKRKNSHLEIKIPYIISAPFNFKFKISGFSPKNNKGKHIKYSFKDYLKKILGYLDFYLRKLIWQLG